MTLRAGTLAALLYVSSAAAQASEPGIVVDRIELRLAELKPAEAHLREALAIRERLAPGSELHMAALYELGRVPRAAGRRQEACGASAAAVDAMEEQLHRLGGSSQQRSFFRHYHANVLRSYLDTLVELRRTAEALQLVERTRAQIREASPRLAELAYLEPLDYAGIEAERDPGTLLLVYAMGVNGSYVFATGPDTQELGVFPIEHGQEWFKALDPRAAIIHVATHAFIDELQPLESALVFAVPTAPGDTDDDSLLQAWEIFEELRIDADLVTLSACDTALGQEMLGEGLIGLTRAFQYAGARSVLASLWSVADVSTAHLMSRFYAALAAGATMDQALRSGQRELIDQPLQLEDDREMDASDPFFWAAFVLIGDWS